MSHHLHPEHLLDVHRVRHRELEQVARHRRWVRDAWRRAQLPVSRPPRPPDPDDELVLAS